MIRQALVALGPRTLLPLTLVGGAAIALGAYFWPHAAATPSAYRLVLHAPEMPGAFYVSAWNEGPVFANHDANDGRSIVYTRRSAEHDGCLWQGIERLIPVAEHAYRYSYQETILACQPDARPFMKTPRTGIVTTEKVAGSPQLTAFDGIQAPGNLWNAEVHRCGCQMQMDEDVDADDDLADDDLDEAMTATNEAINEAMAQAVQALRQAQATQAAQLKAAHKLELHF
jgi:hypothetical protein